MKRQWVLVTVVLAMLGGGAALGMKLAPTIALVAVGEKAPAFEAVNLATGDSASLEQYRGQVMLVNIWATWCEPCRVEMPSMQRLHQALGAEGVKVVAVSIDEADPAVVRAFRDEYQLTFDILQDRTRSIERIYQTTGVPESFVLNRQGTIVKKVIGEHPWDSPADLELFRRLLAQR